MSTNGVRVSNVGKNVDDWCKAVGEPSSFHDICTDCHDELKVDPNGFNDDLKPYGHGEPQGTGGWTDEENLDHPPYNETSYKCQICRCKLK